MSCGRSSRRDFEKHRFWLTIDALGFIASGLLFLVPGPNAVAYYFAFRLVGHYLSMRGARQGLSVVRVALRRERAARRVAPGDRSRAGRTRENAYRKSRSASSSSIWPASSRTANPQRPVPDHLTADRPEP